MPTSAAEAIATLQANLVWNYVGRAPFGMTTLMALIRFTTIGLSVTELMSFLYTSPLKTCRDTYVSSTVFSLLPNILDAVISAIRAYAVSNRSLVWTATVFATGMFVVIVNAYILAADQYQLANVDGTWICFVIVPFGIRGTSSTAKRVLLVSLIFNVLSQAIVAGLTWSRMFFLVRRPGNGQVRVNPRSYSISWLFLRDGTVYFIAIMLLQLVNCLLTYLADVWFFSTFSPLIQIVLLSRLLLNLQQASIRDVNPD